MGLVIFTFKISIGLLKEHLIKALLPTLYFLTFLKLSLAYQFSYGPCHFHIQAFQYGFLNEHLKKVLLPTLQFLLVSKLLTHLSSSSLTATQGSRLDPTQQMDWILLSPRRPGCLSRRMLLLPFHV